MHYSLRHHRLWMAEWDWWITHLCKKNSNVGACHCNINVFGSFCWICVIWKTQTSQLVNFTKQAASLSQAVGWLCVDFDIGQTFCLGVRVQSKGVCGWTGSYSSSRPFLFMYRTAGCKSNRNIRATDYMTKLAVSFTRPIAWLFSTLPRWQHDNGPVLSRRSLYSASDVLFFAMQKWKGDEREKFQL